MLGNWSYLLAQFSDHLTTSQPPIMFSFDLILKFYFNIFILSQWLPKSYLPPLHN